MVYGLNVKSEHGMDWDFESLDGDFRSVGLFDEAPDEGLNPRGRAFIAGRAVDPANVPTKVQWKDINSPLFIPDFSSGPFIHLSARAKALIEEFEPGVHQFLPVEFLDMNGAHLEDRWFLCVCNRLDTVDRDRTKGFILKKYPIGSGWVPIRDLIRRKEFNLIPQGYDTSLPSKLVFNRAQIGNAHLWCDKCLSQGGPFVSDELAAALKASNLSGLRLSDDGVETV